MHPRIQGRRGKGSQQSKTAIMTREDCLLLGTISKTHGVHGELIIRIIDPSFEPGEDWESLFLQIDGNLVPFFISSLRAPKTDEWFVCFDDYDNKERAQDLVGSTVWIHKEFMETVGEKIYMDELSGYALINVTTGRQGFITDFMEIPGNPVFEVSLEREKVLVPAQDDLIEEIDQQNQRLIMRLPEGIM
jgi:16S rRNA processing protein RimM